MTTCSQQRCRRPAKAHGLCLTHVKRECDRLYAEKVRSVGRCEECGCRENLQCAHIVSRRYLNVRWAEGNAVCLCMQCHLRYTHNPLLWEAWCEHHLGYDFTILKRRALAYAKVDYETLLTELRGKT